MRSKTEIRTEGHIIMEENVQEPLPKIQCFREYEPISLTKSQQNYLKIVYELSLSNEAVHISDVAAELKVTKASSCVAMDVLEKKGLIYRDNYRQIRLTETGRNQAMMITYKFKMIRQFLMDILHVSQENATADAGMMEHYLNEETLCGLCKLIDGPENVNP
ncbi:metal-dependent transcriptional regulator [Clostridium aminobutyricum]|uniref:Metal-dependent transcriptional regulator n=1 Tax=Clostridium aminobutyricum TaxID=33953 RepID=A0A939D9E5_CLOAM|nr:metal-dependent transcriptional regulator [Clostridium aminobutyricum]MBN7773550.1 metal-dependent transcriptional regulator [Clostridium aminobutyricum]